MTENERYEARLLAMIRDQATWSYWAFDSRRMDAALNRLIRRGVVTREIVAFPRWRLTIAGVATVR